MGRSKRRRRTEHVVQEQQVPTTAGLPEVLGIDRRFLKFAVAFLIIFVLLWLLAPENE